MSIWVCRKGTESAKDRSEEGDKSKRQRNWVHGWAGRLGMGGWLGWEVGLPPAPILYPSFFEAPYSSLHYSPL